MPNPDNWILSSLYNSFKNYPEPTTGTLNVPAYDIPTGESRNISLTIPLERSDDIGQIRINFSQDSAKWYLFPAPSVPVDANSSVTVVGAFSGSNLILTAYVSNDTAGPITSTAFTITASIYLFVSPF